MLDMDNVKNNMTLSLAVAYNGKPFSGFASWNMRLSCCSAARLKPRAPAAPTRASMRVLKS